MDRAAAEGYVSSVMRLNRYMVSSLARLHRALGDETRLRIVHLLAHRGELCVCDVESILEVSQSKASRHLRHLKHAGVVEDRRNATRVYYRMTPESLTVLRSTIRETKRALADGDLARKDLLRAEASQGTPAWAPMETAMGAGR